VHNARDLIQTVQWQFGIGVDKPKDLPVGRIRPTIHLPSTAALGLHKSITKVGSKLSCAVGASTIGDDNFGSRRSLAQMLKERAYQRCLIKNWNDDRELHSHRFFKSLSTGFAWAFARKFGFEWNKVFSSCVF